MTATPNVAVRELEESLRELHRVHLDKEIQINKMVGAFIDTIASRAEFDSLWIDNVLPGPLITFSQRDGERSYDTLYTSCNSLTAAMGSAIGEYPVETLRGALKELEYLSKQEERLSPTFYKEAIKSLTEKVQTALDECRQIDIDSCNIECVHEKRSEVK